MGSEMCIRDRNIRCFFFSLFIAAPIDVLMLMTPGHHTNVSHTNYVMLFPSFATSFVRLLGRLTGLTRDFKLAQL